MWNFHAYENCHIYANITTSLRTLRKDVENYYAVVKAQKNNSIVMLKLQAKIHMYILFFVDLSRHTKKLFYYNLNKYKILIIRISILLNKTWYDSKRSRNNYLQ